MRGGPGTPPVTPEQRGNYERQPFLYLLWSLQISIIRHFMKWKKRDFNLNLYFEDSNLINLGVFIFYFLAFRLNEDTENTGVPVFLLSPTQSHSFLSSLPLLLAQKLRLDLPGTFLQKFVSIFLPGWKRSLYICWISCWQQCLLV